MIIQNGTIQFKHKTATGIDPETGYPVKPTDASWGNAIPCQYYPNKLDKLGVKQGEHFTIAQYTILIEEQDILSEQIRLSDMSGKEVGQFSIISNEPIQAVCQIKILV